ncbi:unnamed protein product, partial [Symbiodinium microadriaticum]
MQGDTVVIDGKGHLFGRLASVVAKELLAGKRIVIVRCEDVMISGSLTRNKVKYAQFLNKRHNTNPVRGPFHFKSPARILWRSIRGMLPHKTARGQLALARLATFEGIPEPYDKKKRMVIPEAIKVIRLRSDRNFCVLSNLSKEFGWNYGPLVEKLEAQRKIKEQAFYAEKKANA